MLTTSNISSSIKRLRGYLSPELPSKNPFDLIHHNNSETIKSAFIQSINNKTANSADIAYSNGTVYKIEFRGIIYQTKKLLVFLLTPL